MKKYALFLVVVSIFLGGCNNTNSMQDVFHKEMKGLEDVDDYSLINIVEEDNIIFYSYVQEGENNNNQINIGYFNKINGEWFWDKTASCKGKWSGTFGNTPYIWCGTLTEPRHEKVYVGDKEAKIINVDDGVQRVWYHLSENINDKEIKIVLTDGSEEWLKEVIK